MNKDRRKKLSLAVLFLLGWTGATVFAYPTNSAAEYFCLEDAFAVLPKDVQERLVVNAERFTADDLPDAPKSSSLVYTESLLATVRDNVNRYEWAKREREEAVHTADAILARPVEEFLDFMPTPNMIRDGSGATADNYCPNCGKTIKRFEPPDISAHPWVATCLVCGKDPAAGRLGKYFLSGRDDKGWFQRDRADLSLLPEGEALRAASLQAMANYSYLFWTKYGRLLEDLRVAYVLSGDVRYGRYAMETLVRFADFYPYFAKGAVRGGDMIQSGHESWVLQLVALAYDVFYVFAADPQVLSFVNDYRARYGAKRPADGNEIKRYIEGRLYGLIAADRYTSREIMRRIYYHNVGRGWIAPCIIALVLGDTSLGHEYKDAADQFDFDFDDDGSGKEGSLAYDTGGFRMISDVYRDILRFTENPRPVWEKRQVQAGFDLYFDMYCLGRFYPHYGDSHYMAHAYPILDGGSLPEPLDEIAAINRERARDYLLVYNATGRERLARIAWELNDRKIEGLHLTVYDRDPEAIQDKVREVIGESGAPLERNLVAPQLGMMILKSGEGKNRRAVWLRPNRRDQTGTAGWHGHSDSMNIGLFAFGLTLLPDTARFNLKNQVFGKNTVSLQSTSMPKGPDDWGKDRPLPILARTGFLEEFPGVQVMQAHGAEDGKSYRIVFLVDVGEDKFYVVDHFCVSASTEAEYVTYSYHTNQGEMKTSLNFKKSEDVLRGTTRYQGEWLAPLLDADAEQVKEPWWVETAIEDTYGYLEKPSDVKLRMTFLEPADRVSHIFFKPPKGTEGTPDRIPYIFVSRARPQDGGARRFSAVLEPYRDHRVVKSSRIVLREPHGEVVEVVEQGGRKLLFFVSDGTAELKLPGGGAFLGHAGVLIENSNGEKRAGKHGDHLTW